MRFYVKRVDNGQYIVYAPAFKNFDVDTATGVEVFKDRHELENYMGRMCVCSFTDTETNEHPTHVLKVDIDSDDIDHFDFFIDKQTK